MTEREVFDDMTISFGDQTDINKSLKILVVGVGGAGGNAINHFVQLGVKEVTPVVINTDRQDLNKSNAEVKLQIGSKVTDGLGAGSHPEKGRAAAEESEDDIKKFLSGAKMVFLVAGMGGGTGTGATPVIAKIARDLGILTVAVVSTPFPMEGAKRKEMAIAGIEQLKGQVDSLIVISNEKLLINNRKGSFKESFTIADDVLCKGVKSITDMITNQGFLNVDFADVDTAMRNKGFAHMGVGFGEGEDKVESAVSGAIENPILEVSLAGAKNLLVAAVVDENEPLDIWETCMEEIKKHVSPNVNTIPGLFYRDDFEDKLEITVIATDLDSDVNPPEEWAGVTPSWVGNETKKSNDFIVDDIDLNPITDENDKAKEENKDSDIVIDDKKKEKKNNLDSIFATEEEDNTKEEIEEAKKETVKQAKGKDKKIPGPETSKQQNWPFNDGIGSGDPFAIPDFISSGMDDER